MTKKIVEKLVLTAEVARLLKRTTSAVTKSVRAGHFGDTVQRGPRGEYLFRWPAAREAFRARTDPGRYPAKLIDEALVTEPPPVDPALVDSCNELVTAELAALHRKITSGAELDGMDLRSLDYAFHAALVAMTVYDLPVSDAPFASVPFDPRHLEG